ncbi:MAG: hypothetical protein U0K83_04200 [Bacteroidales bacterium]|nr:hypothetical protein [Bacteroidales bacterium]
MARKKKDGYMPKSEVLLILQNYIRTIQMNDYGTDSGIPQLYKTMTYIEDAPTAEVAEVRHGEWLKTEAYPHKVYCSRCLKTYVTNDEIIQGRSWQFPVYCTEAEYCPHCGARMDGDGDD